MTRLDFCGWRLLALDTANKVLVSAATTIERTKSNKAKQSLREVAYGENLDRR